MKAKVILNKQHTLLSEQQKMKKAITLNAQTAILMNERFQQAVKKNDPLAFTVGGASSFSGYCGNILRKWLRETSCNCQEMQENTEIVSWVCPEHGTQESRNE